MQHLQVRDSSAYRCELGQIQKAREQIATLWQKLTDQQLAVTYAGEAGRSGAGDTRPPPR